MEFDSNTLDKIIADSAVPHRSTAVSYIFDCPRCQKKDKLYIRKRDGNFICFYCAEIDGYRGRCEFALKELTGKSLTEIRSLLYGTSKRSAAPLQDFSIHNFFDDPVESPQVSCNDFKMPEDFVSIDSPEGVPGAKYMAGRGIPLDICVQYGVKYSAAQRRVIFPVSGENGVVGYQGRTVAGSKVKILSSSPMPRDTSLLFYERLKGMQHAIVAEGPITTMKAHLCGGNVATMGKIVSDSQINVILKGGIKRIYNALDPDAAPEMAALAQKIGAAAEIYHMIPLPHVGDFGEMTFEETALAFERAERVWPSTVFFHLSK